MWLQLVFAERSMAKWTANEAGEKLEESTLSTSVDTPQPDLKTVYDLEWTDIFKPPLTCGLQSRGREAIYLTWQDQAW